MYTHYSATAPDGTTLIYHTNPNSATWHSFQSYKNNNTWTVIKEFEFDSVRGNVNKVYKFSGYDERNSSVFWALLEVIGSIVCFTCPQWDKVEALWYGKTEITVRRVYTKEKKVKNVDRILKKIFKDRMSIRFDKEPRATQLFGHGAIELVKLVKSALDFDLRSTQDDRQMVKILQLLENLTKDEQEVYIEAVKNNLLEEDRQATNYTERCSALLEFFIIGEGCNNQENEILTQSGISRNFDPVDSVLDDAMATILNRKATEEALNEVLKIEGDYLSRCGPKYVKELIEKLPVSTRVQCVLLANEFYLSAKGENAKRFRHDLLQRLWDVPQEFLSELTEKMAFLQNTPIFMYMPKDMPFNLKLEYLTIITPFLSKYNGSMELGKVLSQIMKVHEKGKQFFQEHGEVIYQACYRLTSYWDWIHFREMIEFMQEVFSDDSDKETDIRSQAVVLLFFLKDPSLFHSYDLRSIHGILKKYSPDDYEELSQRYMCCKKIGMRSDLLGYDWHLVDVKKYAIIAEIFSYLQSSFYNEFQIAKKGYDFYKLFTAIHTLGDIEKINEFFSLFKKYGFKFVSFIYLARSCKTIDSIEKFDEAIQYTSEFFARDAKDIGIGCFDKTYKLIFESNRKDLLDIVKPIVIKYPELTQKKHEFLYLLTEFQDFHDVCEQYAGFACELSKKIRNQPLFILECLAPLSIVERANLIKLCQRIFSNKNLTSVHLSQACFSDITNLRNIDDPNPILNVAEELLDESLEFPAYVSLIETLSKRTIEERNYIRVLWTFMTQGQVKDVLCVNAVYLIIDFFDHLSIPMKDKLYSQVIAVLPYAESIPHSLSMKDRLELIDCLIDIPIKEIPLIVHSLKELQLVIRSHPVGVTDSDTETIDVVKEFIDLLTEKVLIKKQTAYKQQILIEADKFMHACGIDINQLFALDKARLLLEIAKMDCNHGLGWERRAEVYQFFIRKIHNLEQDPLDYIEKNIPIESITSSLITVASIPPEELLSAVNSANCFINFCPKLEERLTVAAEIRRIPFESRENAILLILNALNDWKRDAPVQMTVDFIEKNVMDTEKLKQFSQTISAMSAFLEMAFNSEILPLLPNDALHLILKNVIFQDKWDDILFLLNNGIKKLK